MDDDQFAILQEHIEIIKRDATESKNKTLLAVSNYLTDEITRVTLERRLKQTGSSFTTASMVPSVDSKVATASRIVLKRELDRSIDSLTRFDKPGITEALEEASLPDSILTRVEETEARKLRISKLLEEILDQIKAYNEDAESARTDIIQLLREFQPLKAQNDQLRIEGYSMSLQLVLQKLAKLRNEAYVSLYGMEVEDRSSTVSKQSLKMVDALDAAEVALNEEQELLNKEEADVQHLLQQYDEALELFEGKPQRGKKGEPSTYSEVVDEWLKTQLEIEEIKKDLKRLNRSE